MTFTKVQIHPFIILPYSPSPFLRRVSTGLIFQIAKHSLHISAILHPLNYILPFPLPLPPSLFLYLDSTYKWHHIELFFLYWDYFIYYKFFLLPLAFCSLVHLTFGKHPEEKSYLFIKSLLVKRTPKNPFKE
jgi:hypothetical protein